MCYNLIGFNAQKTESNLCPNTRPIGLTYYCGSSCRSYWSLVQALYYLLDHVGNILVNVQTVSQKQVKPNNQ